MLSAAKSAVHRNAPEQGGSLERVCQGACEGRLLPSLPLPTLKGLSVPKRTLSMGPQGSSLP